LIHHTDCGGRYTAVAGQWARAAPESSTMPSRVGARYDTSMAENVFTMRKTELADPCRWPTIRTARQMIFAWIAACYHRPRSHSALGYRSPVAVEREFANEALGA